MGDYLTPKQIKILTLAVRGYNTKMIAIILGNKTDTIKKARMQMLRRTKSTNMVMLAYEAAKKGII